MFFDESRFGTHSKLGHGWFKKGSRTQVKVKIGFENFYLYSAVCSQSGQHYSLLIPYVNTHCMNIFLKKLSKQYLNKELLLVMDRAGWHKSKELTIPKNIQIIYLPAYSPDLNPVERLWQYIKRNTIRNKLYNSLAELQHRISDFVRQLQPTNVKSICSANYLYN